MPEEQHTTALGSSTSMVETFYLDTNSGRQLSHAQTHKLAKEEGKDIAEVQEDSSVDQGSNENTDWQSALERGPW